MLEALAAVGLILPYLFCFYLYKNMNEYKEKLSASEKSISDCNSAIKYQERAIMSLTRERDELKKKLSSYSANMSKISEIFNNDK